MAEGSIRTVGIAVNPLKHGAGELATTLYDRLLSRGLNAIITDHAIGSGESLKACTEKEVLASHSDMLIVLGGDGTMLRWCRLAAPHGTPMLGINYGKYGFITEVDPDAAEAIVDDVINGHFYISHRLILEASIIRNGIAIETHHALNEVVVSKGSLARMLSLAVHVSGKFIVNYAADGIIISTPTGSTAYSLSAGGPVVHPDIEVMIVTPICPHTLSERALVIPDNEVITIAPEQGDLESNAVLTVDGQHGEPLTHTDTVKVCEAPYKAKLVQLATQSFYDKLRTRLHWGERFL